MVFDGDRVQLDITERVYGVELSLEGQAEGE
jgi:hypothetical protein